jgi:RimJ/RimL family protein N-acetyltransferase
MHMMAEEPLPPALELGDGRLRLRPWQEDDTGDLHDAVRESMASVGRWQPWCHADYGLDDAAAWIEHCWQGWRSGAHYSLAICEAGSGKLLGGIGLNQINQSHRSANMGYWVRQSQQRQGLAAEAGVLLARFGFERLGLIRIEIVAEPGNLPSQRVAEKIGARFEAIARQRLWIHQQARDAAIYALLPRDMS